MEYNEAMGSLLLLRELQSILPHVINGHGFLIEKCMRDYYTELCLPIIVPWVVQMLTVARTATTWSNAPLSAVT